MSIHAIFTQMIFKIPNSIVLDYQLLGMKEERQKRFFSIFFNICILGASYCAMKIQHTIDHSCSLDVECTSRIFGEYLSYQNPKSLDLLWRLNNSNISWIIENKLVDYSDYFWALCASLIIFFLVICSIKISKYLSIIIK